MADPAFSETKRLVQSGNFKIIPISCELYADRITPMEALRKLRNVSSHCYLLESAESNRVQSRYTFLGFDPALELSCTDGMLTLRVGSSITIETKHPKEIMRQALVDNRNPRIENLPSFTSGLVEYFSYDYIKYVEPSLVLDTNGKEGFQNVSLMLFGKVVAFDHFRQKIILVVNARRDHMETEYRRVEMELKELRELLLDGAPKQEAPGRMTSPVHALFDEPAYCAMVERAKEYIHGGDIFQVVLSDRLDVDFEESLLDTYRVLRTMSPSPYMFYFSSDNIETAGASPEALAHLQNGVLHTFPLAGTRPRGKTGEEDKWLKQELLADEKECTGRNMLVDLRRNDIGKISESGSVQVEQYIQIERFSHAVHIGSTMYRTFRRDRDAADVIDSILPAGTPSDAPKVHVCEIINELEDSKRGIYGRAIGYIDFTGNLDTCIAIRIVYKKKGKVFVRSGAGIIANGVPENEYRECIRKARAAVGALEATQGGLKHDSAN